MKRRIRGLKRATFQLDFSLYRVDVPIPDAPGHHLSVIDIWPEHAERTIVFQHGYAGVAESWEYQITHFARDYRVIAPDLRGHSQSDAPYTRYTMEELVNDMHTLVTELNLPEKFILVGHSFGGSVCVEYANAHPERLEKLVLIATAGEYPLPRFIKILRRIPTAILRPLWRYRPRWDAELHVMKRMLFNNLARWRGWSLLRNISTPTLIITGERDNYFPRNVFDDVGKMVPNAEIIDVGTAKHKVQLERYQAVNRALERFIGDQHRSSWRDQTAEMDISRRPWLGNYTKDIPYTVPIPRQPLHRFLESAADWKPKTTATVFYGHTLTYEQLNRRANQFAHALAARGVKVGDRVLIVLPNSPQTVIAYFGALKLGAVVVLPNPDVDAANIVFQADQTRTRIVVTLSENAPLAHVLKERAGVEQIILVNMRAMMAENIYEQVLRRIGLREGGAVTPNDPEYMLDWDAVLHGQPDHNPDKPINADTLAIISYTSGTTDDPKGVCLTHRNLVANALQIRHWVTDLEYGEEVCLSVIPFLHSYGMTAALNLPVTLAGTMLILSVFDLEQVLDHIKRYRPTLFPGVPAMYTAINQAPNVRAYGLSSIKACISGAAPLPVEVQEAFEKLTRGRLVEGYGLTEASPVTHANPLYGMRKVGSIGIPIPNTEAKIVDLITSEPIPPGQIGELLVRGPQVMLGYWNGPDNIDSDSIIKDGWLYTGDVAVMDGDGYFKIISRKRDTILTGEYSVYPRDVEEVLYENAKVLEAAVVGVGVANGERRVKAFVVPRPGTRLSKEELIALCRRRLDEYAVPWDIEFRDELPKSFIGKVLRRMLTEENPNAAAQPDQPDRK